MLQKPIHFFIRPLRILQLVDPINSSEVIPSFEQRDFIITKIFIMKWSEWQQLSNLSPKEFDCGFCGKGIGTNHGYFHQGSGPSTRIYICTNCGCPTFFDQQDNQHPGPILGRDVKGLPNDIENVYREIREDIKNQCFTSAILLGRKLIMHVAVDVAKAKEGESFVAYIEHLEKSNYIPPNASKLLDYLRKLGNEKNHEIKLGNLVESERILGFIEALLFFIYELGGETDES